MEGLPVHQKGANVRESSAKPVEDRNAMGVEVSPR